MQHSFLNINENPSESVSENCTKYGYAAIIMGMSISHKLTPVGYIKSIIEPAVQHKNIKFYFNDDGEVVGYVVWALLAEDVEERVITTKQFSLHSSEWNEGNQPWIIDLLVPFGNLKYVLIDLRDNVFRKNNNVRYFRMKNKSIIQKEVSRTSKCSFFKN